ncbi:Putative aliphatic sulfonates-binding protein [Nocardioides aquaticus]|uniref:Aliphatic sulfonates-binding protein n=1 Tax=Nocardioides aquaticus TaxID=160826 RepID=A0ABX8EIZ7_9ACTN|nr:ABC transporter substrate-binding protein [Nocardioides aquaticus]QVT80321.1 Putative aliphatic sulfonates-binding protein [Nocardioides aquaticus]
MSTRPSPARPSPARTAGRRPTMLAGGLAAALLSGLVAGCSASATGNEDAVNEDGSVDLSQVTLIVGDQRGGSKALLTAAGLLDDAEYDVEFKEFTSGPPLLEALGAGSVHVGGVGNTPPLFAAAAGRDFEVVQAATYGGRGDAIVVPEDSDVDEVADLDGATIAVAEGSSANYHLVAQLEAAGIDYDDVEIKNLQPPDALGAFEGGYVDAWAIWEPYTSQAEQDAGARVIADGGTLANGYNFQAASTEAIEDEATAAALEDYVARIAEAQVWAQTHEQEWADAWSAETGLAPEITLAAVKNRDVEVVPIDDALIASEQEMADTFDAAGLIPEQVDVAPYFSDRYDDTSLAAAEGAR